MELKAVGAGGREVRMEEGGPECGITAISSAHPPKLLLVLYKVFKAMLDS